MLRALRHVADAQFEQPRGARAGDIVAVEDDPALPDRQQAEDRLEHGRLAGAIGADHRGDLSRLDGQRHVGNRDKAGKRFAQTG
jgi:hypothetical protein